MWKIWQQTKVGETNINTSNDEQCKVVPSNDNDSIAIPRENVNIPDSSSQGIDLELNEDVEPIVTSGNQETVEKINIPEVRHSSRCNKGVNKKLEQDYEFYNVNYCQLSKCKLRASATSFPTSCDGGRGDS